MNHVRTTIREVEGALELRFERIETDRDTGAPVAVTSTVRMDGESAWLAMQGLCYALGASGFVPPPPEDETEARAWLDSWSKRHPERTAMFAQVAQDPRLKITLGKICAVIDFLGATPAANAEDRLQVAMSAFDDIAKSLE